MGEITKNPQSNLPGVPCRVGPEEVETRGMGLITMRERTSQLNGKFEFEKRARTRHDDQRGDSVSMSAVRRSPRYAGPAARPS